MEKSQAERDAAYYEGLGINLGDATHQALYDAGLAYGLEGVTHKDIIAVLWGFVDGRRMYDDMKGKQLDIPNLSTLYPQDA